MIEPQFIAKLIGRYSELTILVVFVLFGASTHAVVNLKKARDNNVPFGVIDFFIALFIAAFSGTLFGLTAEALGFEGTKLYMAASVGAFLGLTGLNKIADLLLEVISKGVKK